MPSVPKSRFLEEPPTLCAHAAKLTKGDVALDQRSAKGGCSSSKVQGTWLQNGVQATVQRNWIRPDLPSRCTWRPGANASESPHSHRAL